MPGASVFLDRPVVGADHLGKIAELAGGGSVVIDSGAGVAGDPQNARGVVAVIGRLVLRECYSGFEAALLGSLHWGLGAPPHLRR
ncbi:hypothetical protein MRS76_18680 [Rhizobiaceae bacterium n13]|uniref:hypothetical protein n=1 Tax=Ferirhizobium litorale TaxID=2927786 RepID=UPI0024B2B99E|nr:hypothetical protein [Fererhizobium litorale]MDI7863976.1 hypothetical protein [Fererhizobium litorale]